jgi:hypothetical protein
MATATETVGIEAPAETVFAYGDDIRDVGWQMTERSSMAMMGSRLKLEILSEQPSGLGATYRYCGTMMGLSLDFSESVTRYVPNREKVWRTIGKPRLVIISSYEMRLAVAPRSASSSRLTISIAYELPVRRCGGCSGGCSRGRTAAGACARWLEAPSVRLKSARS